MLITDKVIESLQTGFNLSFQQGFGSVTPTWQQIAMRVSSSAKVETYGWMKGLPAVREWIGQRVINNLEATGAQIVNRDWEHTIGVDSNDIEDDRLGIYAPMFAMQGEVVARHPDDLVWSLLAQGMTTTGLDGQYFFDTDHASHDRDGKEVSYSNVQVGAGPMWVLMDLSRAYMKPLIFQVRKEPQFVALNRPEDWHAFFERQLIFGAHARYTAAFGFHQLAYASQADLDATNFDAARLAMQTQFGVDGSPMPIRATHIVVPPALQSAAEKLLKMPLINGGESNPHAGAVEIIVSPWLE